MGPLCYAHIDLATLRSAPNGSPKSESLSSRGRSRSGRVTWSRICLLGYLPNVAGSILSKVTQYVLNHFSEYAGSPLNAVPPMASDCRIEFLRDHNRRRPWSSLFAGLAWPAYSLSIKHGCDWLSMTVKGQSNTLVWINRLIPCSSVCVTPAARYNLSPQPSRSQSPLTHSSSQLYWLITHSKCLKQSAPSSSQSKC